MKGWVFTSQALMLWMMGIYACLRPRHAKWVLMTVFATAVVLPLIVAWISP